MPLIDKITLDVGFCFYETSLLIVKRSIESIKDHVRYIFAIDGKFEFFNSEQDLSSNEVRDYLKSVQKVKLIDYPNRKESEKRQVYLNMCNECMSDFLLVIDADEYITDETNWNTVYDDLIEKINHSTLPEILCVTFRPNKNSKKEINYPRILKRPYLIQYMKTHHFFQFKTDGSIYKSATNFPLIHGIFMSGTDEDREPRYQKKSNEYQLKLMEYERPYKQEYNKVVKNNPDEFD